MSVLQFLKVCLGLQYIRCNLRPAAGTLCSCKLGWFLLSDRKPFYIPKKEGGV